MEIATFLTAALLIHYLAAFFHIRHYQKSVENIVSLYKTKEGYFLYSGMKRGMFKPGAVALIVVKKDYMVEDCYVLKGRMVLSKFKKYKKYIGCHVTEILEDYYFQLADKGKKRHRVPSLLSALSMAAENAILSLSYKKM